MNKTSSNYELAVFLSQKQIPIVGCKIPEELLIFSHDFIRCAGFQRHWWGVSSVCVRHAAFTWVYSAKCRNAFFLTRFWINPLIYNQNLKWMQNKSGSDQRSEVCNTVKTELVFISHKGEIRISLWHCLHKTLVSQEL